MLRFLLVRRSNFFENFNITVMFFVQEERIPYDVPVSMGIVKLLESPLDITTSTIIKRIVSNHEAYQVPQLLPYNLCFFFCKVYFLFLF